MNQASRPRTAAKIIGDLLDAANAAADLVARGKDAWDHDRLLRLADEAVISRIGDAAAKLPDDVKAAPLRRTDGLRGLRIGRALTCGNALEVNLWRSSRSVRIEGVRGSKSPEFHVHQRPSSSTRVTTVRSCSPSP